MIRLTDKSIDTIHALAPEHPNSHRFWANYRFTQGVQHTGQHRFVSFAMQRANDNMPPDHILGLEEQE